MQRYGRFRRHTGKDVLILRLSGHAPLLTFVQIPGCKGRDHNRCSPSCRQGLVVELRIAGSPIRNLRMDQSKCAFLTSSPARADATPPAALLSRSPTNSAPRCKYDLSGVVVFNSACIAAILFLA
jgi:hypothetical protein